METYTRKSAFEVNFIISGLDPGANAETSIWESGSHTRGRLALGVSFRIAILRYLSFGCCVQCEAFADIGKPPPCSTSSPNATRDGRASPQRLRTSRSAGWPGPGKSPRQHRHFPPATRIRQTMAPLPRPRFRSEHLTCQPETSPEPYLQKRHASPFKSEV